MEPLYKRVLNGESPSTALLETVSPMTDLAQELGLTTIASPLISASLKDSATPVCSDRLMKCGLRVSGGSPASRRGSLRPRRINLGGGEGDPSMPDENNPPRPSPSKFAVVRQLSRSRVPLEDHDPNSQDSGYGVSDDSKSPSSFKFREPSGVAPRRLGSISESSPRRNLLATSFESSSSLNDGSSQGSMDDDGFLEIFSLKDKQQEEMEECLPSGMGSLFSASILGQGRQERRRPLAGWPSPDSNFFRRCASESMVRAGSKRPLSELGEQQVEAKRLKAAAEPRRKSAQAATPVSLKGTLFQFGFTKGLKAPPAPVVLLRSPHDPIKMALQRSDSGEDLTGDFSKPCALPLVPGGGKNKDLKAISPDTLADLIRGRYDDRIASFRIIDCRYPYEYLGGHIKGATNLYTQEQLKAELMSGRAPVSSQEAGDKRHILVFHCEFSFERGPRMSRYLRQEDRRGNEYPWLRYPELYLLHGGYQAFYATHSTLCEPRSYTPMSHPEHSEDLKVFRARSKSWAGASASGGKTLRLSRLF